MIQNTKSYNRTGLAVFNTINNIADIMEVSGNHHKFYSPVRIS